MSTISLCMIVKNEEAVLARCLKSIKNAVDEIIIIDTGSTDNTKQIARKFTNKVYDFKWCNDFSVARNYSFSFAKCDYIMWLDADDVVPKTTQKYIKKIKENLTADVCMFKYAIAFSDKKETFCYYRERIIKNCKYAVWQGVVHECICPFGKVEYFNRSIHHKKITKTSSLRNLKIYQNLKTKRPLTAREQYYFARELYDNKKYKQCIKEMEKFCAMPNAFVENVIDGLTILYYCNTQLNNGLQALNCLFKTFIYDTPRANICCFIGNHFFLQKKYEESIYWYTQATKCKDVTKKGGFVEPFYYNYYPYLQLCCCYYYLNNLNKAIMYNNKAKKISNSPATKANEQFFNNLINN